MHMRKTLVTVVFAGLCLTGASAQDVFVYNAGSERPLLTVNNLQRIEFGEGAISFFQTNAAEGTPMDLNSIDYMLFYNREILNSVRPTAKSEGVNISYDGKNVSVESVENISSIDVYSSDGVKVATVSPKAKSAKVSLASKPAGVYIVKATAGKSTAKSEIVKK